MKFNRFAIYFIPDQIELANLGASWLGWDIITGKEVRQIELSDFDIKKFTEQPKKYGFHATIKAPFIMKGSKRSTELISAFDEFAEICSPVVLEGLEVKKLGDFLAFRPVGSEEKLNSLVANVVEHFDRFRAPLTQKEIVKRRRTKLTTIQEALMKKWGYPFVMSEFQFHITLTGPLCQNDADMAYSAVRSLFGGIIKEPFKVNSLCLAGEDENGRFHLIKRFELLG
tara:strand:- start:144 stop:824 length:681 start_codon:yes stop_codon:yes gene_type:complete